ncbi:MAG: methionyl-tRNA formyltransferase [Chloroflexi bacterium]|nr:methionyl-tRNA formyltransferase [Chloroflexota bacterium]
MRVVFLGSPAFAVAPLERLAADARYHLVGVVTQPDRPAGRSKQPVATPVKQAALRLGLPVLTPETLRDAAAVAQLAALRPDVGVVAAYGEILRRDVLAIPPLGYVNIHPSLLPLYRGPSPVAGAILNGDTHTGVTIMLLEPKMDSGPILAQRVVPLPPDARAGAITRELFDLGASMLVDVLVAYGAGTIAPRPQDHAHATFTRLLTRTDGEIDWSLPAVQIERMTRAYDPWPGAVTSWRGAPLKIIAARTVPDWRGAELPGVLLDAADGPAVATGEGLLVLVMVQLAGKRPVMAADWRRGLRLAGGERLGEW